MPGALADGKGIFVDDGSEPTNHMNADEADDTPIEEDEVDPEVPQPGDADYVEPEGDDDTDDEAEEPVEVPKEYQDALAFQRYIQTKDGAADFLIEVGMGFGKSLEELEAFFGGDTSSDTDDDEEDGDRVMTVAEWKAAEAARERREQEQREADRRAAQAQVIQNVALEKLNAYRIGEDEELTNDQKVIVANFCDDLLDEETMWDPEKVKEAMDKGFQRFLASTGFSSSGKKVVKRKRVPTPLKGKSGGAVEEEEPKTLKDAFARARKQLDLT